MHVRRRPSGWDIGPQFPPGLGMEEKYAQQQQQLPLPSKEHWCVALLTVMDPITSAPASKLGLKDFCETVSLEMAWSMMTKYMQHLLHLKGDEDAKKKSVLMGISAGQPMSLLDIQSINCFASQRIDLKKLAPTPVSNDQASDEKRDVFLAEMQNQVFNGQPPQNNPILNPHIMSGCKQVGITAEQVYVKYRADHSVDVKTIHLSHAKSGMVMVAGQCLQVAAGPVAAAAANGSSANEAGWKMNHANIQHFLQKPGSHQTYPVQTLSATSGSGICSWTVPKPKPSVREVLLANPFVYTPTALVSLGDGSAPVTVMPLFHYQIKVISFLSSLREAMQILAAFTQQHTSLLASCSLRIFCIA